MDNLGSVLAGGGVSGVVFGIFYLLFKYLSTHKVKIVSGCCKIEAEEDRTPKEELKEVKVHPEPINLPKT
jgi:hypothetical protein